MAMSMPMVGVIGRNEQRVLPGKGAANARPEFVNNHTVPAVLNEIMLEGGFAPLGLPPFANETLVDQNMSMVSGLVFFGGSDWYPNRSGLDMANQSNRTGMEYDDPRDQAELAYLAAAKAWGIPVLGLCRGAQGLNIIYGGTLRNIDHLTSPFMDPSDPNNHFWLDHPDGAYAHTHDVLVRLGGSAIAQAIATANGGMLIEGVASAHHHAIDQVGESLVVVGVSPGSEQITEDPRIIGPHPGTDQVIEIIADREGLMVGVQGHPEMQRGHPYAQAVFQNFFEFARQHVPIVSRSYATASSSLIVPGVPGRQ